MNEDFEDKHPKMRSVRHLTDTWKFWMVVAYVVLAFVAFTVWANHNDSQTAVKKAAKIEAARIAQKRASNLDAVNSCFTLWKAEPIRVGFANGYRQLAQNSVDSLEEILSTMNPADPLWKVRTKALIRSKAALRNATALVKAIRDVTPTYKHCVTLANTLNVQIPKQYRNGRRAHVKPVRNRAA